MFSVPEASARILERIHPLPVERVPLAEALGRVLAARVVSPLMIPAWDNSAMDGYAVLASDVAGATPESPVMLDVTETVAAGAFPSGPVERGRAVRIMTGAPIPEGADSVVRVEDTDDGVARVLIHSGRDAGRNVRRRGEDIREGDVVLEAGQPLGAAQLGVLASVGAATVEVHRRPRVAFLASGDEIVDLDRFDEVLSGEKIVSSNSYTLRAMIQGAGGEPVSLGIARDDPDELRERLTRATELDLLITSAGISAGEYDYIRPVLAELGVRLDVWRVRMRPGAPLGHGWIGRVPWIGLPGNPVSTMVTFDLFVRPVIRRLLGHDRLFRVPIPVVLEEPVSIGAKLTHFLRAVVRAESDGRLHARLTGAQGSGILTSMARANALLIVPEDRSHSAAGETLNAFLLGEDAQLGSRFAL
ncbi:MAG TPA: gephyrin-like molybdotransferase Glp [Gemmatimonadaceae bacterium]|jgi:molybdopterin molybdotransferase|nr:gephyrin-like molybdotransferase Glp [Gemmatimonadaceae bacterium]